MITIGRTYTTTFAGTATAIPTHHTFYHQILKKATRKSSVFCSIFAYLSIFFRKFLLQQTLALPLFCCALTFRRR
jgi:hypothetical protein